MAHPLDRPVQAALTTRHSGFAQIQGTARRYDPGIVPFATHDPDVPEDLMSLVPAGAHIGLVDTQPLDAPMGFTEQMRGALVQMQATGRITAPNDPRITRLTPADAKEMTALADVTRPGPFTDRAQEIGRFWGIRDGGALIAMAGERMAADGYREVSGVCTAEAARGQGLARILSCHVAALIQSEGDVPFLHAYASNAAARALYERIGFVVRAEVSFGIFQRDG